MKVLTFSKVFPQKHINAGEPTNFKEKILSGEKIHTIRPETNKWKIGDQISMRYWTGKPYHSKQEIFCEKFEVVELIPICIVGIWSGNSQTPNDPINFIKEAKDLYSKKEMEKIAKNDGLNFNQLESWFKLNEKSFKGTLIAWQPTNY